MTPCDTSPLQLFVPMLYRGEKPDLHHRRSTTVRTIPHVVADCAYLRDPVSAATITVLVVLILPFNIYFATVVNSKGPEPDVVKRLGRLFRECGLTHYTYRSDREAALRSALWAAAIEDGIPTDRITDVSNTHDPDDDDNTGVVGVAVPEESAPGGISIERTGRTSRPNARRSDARNETIIGRPPWRARACRASPHAMARGTLFDAFIKLSLFWRRQPYWIRTFTRPPPPPSTAYARSWRLGCVVRATKNETQA